MLIAMRVTESSLPGVRVVTPQRFGDQRGWFAEMFHAGKFQALGLPSAFVQDNQSMSARGVLRGLHYQPGSPQGKLVRVLRGHIWDVAVDIRRGSPNFGQWAGFHLRPENDAGDLEMLWISEGFAHGFLVLSDVAEVLYKTTRVYAPEDDRAVRWNDPGLAIDWPLDQLEGTLPSLSGKDAAAPLLIDAELPVFGRVSTTFAP